MKLNTTYISAIEDKLNDLLTDNESILLQAARYSIFTPGKRLRPLLTLLSAEAFGCNLEKALIPACAIEMVHTYSLIHDDLPCMDDDDLRRGKPSLHKVYPEGQAILAGNFLYNHAFHILATAPLLSSEERLQLIHCMTGHLGLKGLLGGQSIDLLASDSPLEDDEFFVMLEHKTASLICACLEFGAICGGAGIEAQLVMRDVGVALGCAFQCVDDLLDFDPNERSSLAARIGPEKTRSIAETLLQNAESRLKQLPLASDNLLVLMRSMVYRSA